MYMQILVHKSMNLELLWRHSYEENACVEWCFMIWTNAAEQYFSQMADSLVSGRKSNKEVVDSKAIGLFYELPVNLQDLLVIMEK